MRVYLTNLLLFVVCPGFFGGLRFASKKASGGGNKNPKQAPGNHKGIKIQDGKRCYPSDRIVHKMSKLWFHPGANVSKPKSPKYLKSRKIPWFN